MRTAFPKHFVRALVLVTIVLAAAPVVLAQSIPRIEVVLNDDSIDMPRMIPDGWVVLVVSNEGDHDHGLVFENQAFTRRLVRHLQPGSSTTVRVRLFAGVYEVYCPIGNNARNGVSTVVRVVRNGGG
jgi:hypothetical protein